MNGTIFTLRNLYRDGTICLEKAGIADAKLDAWYLLEYETKISRAMFLADPDKEVEKDKAEHYRKDIETRAQRIPLQHITGEQEFMGLDFKVNEHVLIPRQDTETLVEEALKKIRPGMQILDMCTGSGCILESILKFAERKGICVSGTGCDISEEALKVAKENDSRLQTGAVFIQGDLFENIAETYDMIVSNPPYIRTEEISSLEDEVKLHDRNIWDWTDDPAGFLPVQRVPETESGGRIHTSTITVAVMPEAEDVDIQIDEKDIRIDVMRASGNGGQCVNTTDSAVRLTHYPTGIVIYSQTEKSQLQNKDKAFALLRAKLYDLECQKRHDAEAEARKSQIGTGDRSEKIRTYNFPQGRVTDHRIGLTLYKLDKIMNGDIQEIIDACIAADQAAKLANMNEEM